jgi:hypothetical protein
MALLNENILGEGPVFGDHEVIACCQLSPFLWKLKGEVARGGLRWASWLAKGSAGGHKQKNQAQKFFHGLIPLLLHS